MPLIKALSSPDDPAEALAAVVALRAMADKLERQSVIRALELIYQTVRRDAPSNGWAPIQTESKKPFPSSTRMHCVVSVWSKGIRRSLTKALP
jgi:hypothetical protein